MDTGRLVADFGVERTVADQVVGVFANLRIPERFARTRVQWRLRACVRLR
jgi:hypothetical protein